MANVHRLNDDDDDDFPRRRIGLGLNNQNGILDPNLKIPFVSQSPSEQVNPRNESFWQMLKINLCPSFKVASFTFVVLALNTFVFLIECSKTYHFGQSFLEIDQNSLIDMGANVPIEVKQNGGYYRLIVAIFLHANFLHLIFNQISVFVIMSALEYTYGVWNIAIIYLLSGIGGNLFAAHFSNNYEIFVGCSGSVTGLLACVLSYFIINWNKLEEIGQLREYFLCIFIMVLLMAFLFPGPSSISTYSHVGGFIAGLFAGIAIPEPVQLKSYEKYARIFGWILLIIFFFLIIVMISTGQ